MTTHRLTIGGLQLNVSVRGRGSPVLLINGLGGLIRAFDPLRNELADYQTITGMCQESESRNRPAGQCVCHVMPISSPKYSGNWAST